MVIALDDEDSAWGVDGLDVRQFAGDGRVVLRADGSGAPEHVALAALAPEMARTLLAVEFFSRDEIDPSVAVCPECDADDKHADDCKLGALCDRIRVLAGLPPDWVPPR